MLQVVELKPAARNTTGLPAASIHPGVGPSEGPAGHGRAWVVPTAGWVRQSPTRRLPWREDLVVAVVVGEFGVGRAAVAQAAAVPVVAEQVVAGLQLVVSVAADEAQLAESWSMPVTGVSPVQLAARTVGVAAVAGCGWVRAVVAVAEPGG